MTKAFYLEEFQKRLPEDIKIIDETSFDFIEDEFVSVLCWLKYFKYHYEVNGKIKNPDIIFPIISKRIRLDFGLYITKCDEGQHNIYISDNRKSITGKIEKQSLKAVIRTWHL